MQLLKLAVAVVATLTSTAFAGDAIVLNNCTFPVYYKLTGMGGMAGPVKTLAPQGEYIETYIGPGSAILLGRTTTLRAPLTVEYSPNGTLLYYDLSNNAGNPFVAFTNTLIPSIPTCASFKCAPNAANCYSNGESIKVKTCNTKTNLTTTLCA